MYGAGLSEQYSLFLIPEGFEKGLQQTQLLEGRSCMVIGQEREQIISSLNRGKNQEEFFRGL